MTESSARTEIEGVRQEEVTTAAPPPFRQPGRAIDTGSLHLRALPRPGERVGDFELLREQEALCRHRDDLDSLALCLRIQAA